MIHIRCVTPIILYDLKYWSVKKQYPKNDCGKNENSEMDE